ncbi:MAG: hypothetical protein EA353_04585 [Puniceicoccaceae bacterium]|nr:MAG: hypothetical protein EA353_04585 [Puniceicoccaceae bacterium]
MLPRALSYAGVAVDSVERAPDGGLLVSGVVFERESLRVAADRILLPNEVDYLWAVFSGVPGAGSFIEAGQLRVFLSENKREATPEVVYLPELYQAIEDGLVLADRWAPPVRVEAVEVINESGQMLLLASDLSYAGRSLQGLFQVNPVEGPFGLDAELPAGAPGQLSLRHEATDTSLVLQLERRGDAVQIAGDLHGNLQQTASQLKFSADFGPASWVPSSAHAESASFDLGAYFEQFVPDVGVRELSLSRLEFDWDGVDYRAALGGRAVADFSQFEPDLGGDLGEQSLAFALSGSGDLDGVLLQELLLRSEWLELELSDPLQFNWREAVFAGRAHLAARMDLGAQAWFDADGVLEASLDFGLEKGTSGLGVVGFSLQGSGLRYQDFLIEDLESRGRVDAERLELETLRLWPSGRGAGDVASLAGSIIFADLQSDFEYEGTLEAGLLNAMIGQPLLVEPLRLHAGRIVGAWPALEIRGDLETSLQSEATEQIDLKGQFLLRDLNSLEWAGAIHCEGAEIIVEATARQSPAAWSVEVASLRWTDPVRPEWILVAPVRLDLQRTEAALEQRLSMSALTLRGSDSKASVAYSPEAGLEAEFTNLSLVRVDRWLRAELSAYHLESARLSISKFRPYLEGSISVGAEERIVEGAQARLEILLQLRERGISVERVELGFLGQSVLSGGLELPLRLRIPEAGAGDGDAAEFYELLDGALSGQLKGASTPEFSRWLEARTGIRMDGASIDVDLGGALDQPVGYAHLRLDEFGLGARFPEIKLPAIEKLDLRLRVDETSLDVQRFDFVINRERVSARYTMPVSTLRRLRELDFSEPWLWMQEASGSIELENWQMQNWQDWLPPYFRQSGSLSGALELERGLVWAGDLQFENFGLRPTDSLPAVDSIGGRIRLRDRMLEIEEAGAKVGGSPIELHGWINLQEWQRPLWSFDLSGVNVPVVRTTSMILRSDIDLHLKLEDAAATPILSGELRLRSGTLLVDIDPLAPSLQRGPRMRPPFFSITEELFADWRFDLKLSGNDFVRVRSPYFRTSLSADLDLKGSFAQPELTGSVQNIGGELFFPGAKFALDDGEAFIEASRPNVMQLDFSGMAQRASRVITMEVRNTLDDPQIQFQSSPPMSQADTVRFLATGSTTGSGLGNVGLYLGQGMMGAGSMNESLADRVSVDLGEETTRSGRNTLGVRFELTPVWSIQGEYDIYDSYNANLIWSLFKR